MVKRKSSVYSAALALVINIVSASLFSLDEIKFETLTWIMVGSLFFLLIIFYQEISKEVEDQNFEIKRIDEKLKIYERLAKIEEKLKI